ncbi:MAG: SRPBCC family protein [Gammaproteobacteria bacterium]|nr:SRPBCC family protein [Gammaproteobacteria bacterium]
MKLKTEVVIDADRATVWRLFDDTGNLHRWQPTLKSCKHQSGQPGEPDAVAKLVYDEKGREIVLTETITARRQPDFLAGTYESKWGAAVVVNQFEETADGRTRWTAFWNHSFRGVMKFMALFARKSIIERTEGDAQRFKLFVESMVAGEGA